jgi:hypothetical protein
MGGLIKKMLPFDFFARSSLITVLFKKTRQAVERNGFICIFRLFPFFSLPFLYRHFSYLESLCNYYEIYVL